MRSQQDAPNCWWSLRWVAGSPPNASRSALACWLYTQIAGLFQCAVVHKMIPALSPNGSFSPSVFGRCRLGYEASKNRPPPRYDPGATLNLTYSLCVKSVVLNGFHYLQLAM